MSRPSVYPKLKWFRESLYGNIVPVDMPPGLPADACWIAQTTSEKGRYHAGCLREDRYFKTLQAAKRWCERRLAPRMPGMR